MIKYYYKYTIMELKNEQYINILISSVIDSYLAWVWKIDTKEKLMILLKLLIKIVYSNIEYNK